MDIRVHNRQLPVQLPIWPDGVRGGPNPLLRSALFAGVPSRYRKVFEARSSASHEPEGITIASQDGISLRYTGTQLNQYDADVFFEIIHRLRRNPLGQAAYFNGCDFLRAIGRHTSKPDYEDLDTSLRRLKRGVLDVRWTTRDRHLIYTGSLIDSLVRDTATREYCVSLSPNTKTLFESSSFTYLEWSERKRLIRSPLAQWLHSYYSTHAKPFSVTIAFLQTTSGQDSARTRDFLRSLRNALEMLQEQVGWTCEWPDGGLLKMIRTPSAAQERSIGRRSTRPRASGVIPKFEGHLFQRPKQLTAASRILSTETRQPDTGLVRLSDIFPAITR